MYCQQTRSNLISVNRRWFSEVPADVQAFWLTGGACDWCVCVRMGQKGNKTTDFTTSLHSARPGKSKSSYHTLSTNIVASLMFGTWAASVWGGYSQSVGAHMTETSGCHAVLGRWLDETLWQSYSRSLLHFALPFQPFKWSSGILIGSKGSISCALWVVILTGEKGWEWNKNIKSRKTFSCPLVHFWCGTTIQSILIKLLQHHRIKRLQQQQASKSFENSECLIQISNFRSPR